MSHFQRLGGVSTFWAVDKPVFGEEVFANEKGVIEMSMDFVEEDLRIRRCCWTQDDFSVRIECAGTALKRNARRWGRWMC